ncbi:5-formyltetrahydrofolate cyclo-ligase [Candidatus Borreliella tachyglossi]|uniref:5-formyltetrahydrofolate cyclo-ligase n=1 Tax=Candidatus Borreliella tachyglossi TaxID=1964448 RepID=A0A2S1LWP9_9SPIR|nr:5-formyltetrahydrofolate cyclo-ligase [Candidatus Borreliella tachyglossi]AWG42706.1 5-formyltetrahydrofolate cyclo-ligase [Candidatus Borreliella tachyglossi]
MNIGLSKQAIRNEMTVLLRNYGIVKIAESSINISANLLKLIKNINTCQVLAYYPMKFEVQIHVFLNSLLDFNFEVFLPRVLGNCDMSFFKYFGNSSLRVGSFNLLEPISCIEFEINKASVILVPGLAFSSNTGHRVGRGGGFYDIFLQRDFFVKIGVCFDFQIFNFVPFCSHDIKVDAMISEKGVLFL